MFQELVSEQCLGSNGACLFNLAKAISTVLLSHWGNFQMLFSLFFFLLASILNCSQIREMWKSRMIKGLFVRVCEWPCARPLPFICVKPFTCRWQTVEWLSDSCWKVKERKPSLECWQIHKYVTILPCFVPRRDSCRWTGYFLQKSCHLGIKREEKLSGILGNLPQLEAVLASLLCWCPSYYTLQFSSVGKQSENRGCYWLKQIRQWLKLISYHFCTQPALKELEVMLLDSCVLVWASVYCSSVSKLIDTSSMWQDALVWEKKKEKKQTNHPQKKEEPNQTSKHLEQCLGTLVFNIKY